MPPLLLMIVLLVLATGAFHVARRKAFALAGRPGQGLKLHSKPVISRRAGGTLVRAARAADPRALAGAGAPDHHPPRGRGAARGDPQPAAGPAQPGRQRHPQYRKRRGPARGIRSGAGPGRGALPLAAAGQPRGARGGRDRGGAGRRPAGAAPHPGGAAGPQPRGVHPDRVAGRLLDDRDLHDDRHHPVGALRGAALFQGRLAGRVPLRPRLEPADGHPPGPGGLVGRLRGCACFHGDGAHLRHRHDGRRADRAYVRHILVRIRGQAPPGRGQAADRGAGGHPDGGLRVFRGAHGRPVRAGLRGACWG